MKWTQIVLGLLTAVIILVLAKSVWDIKRDVQRLRAVDEGRGEFYFDKYCIRQYRLLPVEEKKEE